MATTTETLSLSLPASTAPTDLSESTCLPHSSAARGPRPQQQQRRADSDWETLDWDTSIVQGLAFSPPKPVDGAEAAEPRGQHQHQGDHWECECDDDDSGSAAGKSMEESCKRSLDHFPSPAVGFPRPALEFDFRLAVTLKPEPSRIDGRRSCPPGMPAAAAPGPGTDAAPSTGPSGSSSASSSAPSSATATPQKEITTISSGRWSGSFGNGRVMAGGYDLGQARGFRPIRIVEGAFVMQTTDEPPAILEMRTRGSLSGPSDVLDALLSPRQPKQIDPRRYGFRMFSTIKTADKRYAEIVNCGLWVASGVWKGEEMIIE